MAPPDIDPVKRQANTRFINYNLRLPGPLHAQLLLLRDRLPNTSLQKIISGATEDAVRRLMKEYRVTMPRE